MNRFKLFSLGVVKFLLLSTVCFGDLAKAIETMDQRTRDHVSDAVIIKRNGEVLYQMSAKDDFDMIAAWSVTKSFISLGIGILYDEGRIQIDQPVYDFFPSWKSGVKSRVTIRHLLTHTSGLDHKMGVEDLENALRGDCIEIASSKEMISEPGTDFHYNNFATNILSGIIQEVTGERADLFIKRRILNPIGIVNYRWDVDEAGHAFGMCGLHVRADELIHLAELILDKGVWNGQRLISEEWLELSLATSVELSDPMFANFRGCGFLWWVNDDEPKFVTAAGLLGQYCVVFPDERVVAVRLHDFRRHSNLVEVDDRVKYRSFFDDVKAFVKEAR